MNWTRFTNFEKKYRIAYYTRTLERKSVSYRVLYRIGVLYAFIHGKEENLHVRVIGALEKKKVYIAQHIIRMKNEP